MPRFYSLTQNDRIYFVYLDSNTALDLSTLNSWKEEDLIFAINFPLVQVFNCKMPLERGCAFGRNHTTELGFTQLLLSLDRSLKRIWLFLLLATSLLPHKGFCVILSNTAHVTIDSWKEDLIFTINVSLVHVSNCKMPSERGFAFSQNHTTELGFTQLLLSLNRSLNPILLSFLFYFFLPHKGFVSFIYRI